MEIYYMSINNVGVICTSKESVIEWIKYSLDKGIAPSIERIREAA